MSELTSLFKIIEEDENKAFSKETKALANQLKEHYYDEDNLDENSNPRMLYDLDEDYPILISPLNLKIYSSLKAFAANGQKSIPSIVADLSYRVSAEGKRNKKAKTFLNDILEEKLGVSLNAEPKQSLLSKIKNMF